MEISKTYITDKISFNKINLIPVISDIFVKNISIITIEGEVLQLDVNPFILEERVNISNPIQNCSGVIITVAHDYIESESQLDDCLVLTTSKSEHSRVATLYTKPSRINVKNIISVILKADGNPNTIYSANVGIRGYDENDTEVFNESVVIGIGESREIVANSENLDYIPDSFRIYKDGYISNIDIETNNLKIPNFSKDIKYIYKPKYLNNYYKHRVSENILIDANNNIYIDSKIKYVECVVRLDILDISNTSPVIKYIGVMSK